MDEFNFEQLINFEVPAGWEEKALDLPSQVKKKRILPLFYRYAIGAAALVIIAAVSLSLMLGIGKDVNMTAPNAVHQSDSGYTSDGTDPGGTGNSTMPSEGIPSIFGGDNDGSAVIVTEPSENSGNITENSPSKPGAKSSNRHAARGENQNSGSKQPSTVTSENTQPHTDSPAEPPATQEPTQEPWISPPTDDYPQPTELEPMTEEPMTAEPGNEDINSYFITIVDKSLAQGNIYCRLEDENGNILGNGNLYSYSHRAMKYDLDNRTVRLTYLLYITQNGKRYNIIFYNSEGVVIKQGNVFAYRGSYHYI